MATDSLYITRLRKKKKIEQRRKHSQHGFCEVRSKTTLLKLNWVIELRWG